MSVAGTKVFSQKSANGTMVFSDAPLKRGQFSRANYKASYGRPVATASCVGMTNNRLVGRARQYEKHIAAASEQYKLDPALIVAVVATESCFDEKAVSVVGAQGLMQLMPKTAQSLGVTNAFDARQNIFGGAQYLSRMLTRYKQDQALALAAYNAGPGAVDKYNGIPPYPETQAYVKKVQQRYQANGSKNDS